MVVEEKKNMIKMGDAFFSLLSYFFGLLVKLVTVKPRSWMFFICLVLISCPSILQAASLPDGDIINDSLNTSSLVTVKSNKNFFDNTTIVKTSGIEIKNGFCLNKWFSEIISDFNKFVFRISDFYEDMACEGNRKSTNESECEDDGILGFYHSIWFWYGFLSGIAGFIIHLAQPVSR